MPITINGSGTVTGVAVGGPVHTAIANWWATGGGAAFDRTLTRGDGSPGDGNMYDGAYYDNGAAGVPPNGGESDHSIYFYDFADFIAFCNTIPNVSVSLTDNLNTIHNAIFAEDMHFSCYFLMDQCQEAYLNTGNSMTVIPGSPIHPYQWYPTHQPKP